MSYALRWCKENLPVGMRVNIKRSWWVDWDKGIYHTDRCNGTVVKHWRATGDMPGITVKCDDGREHSGEPNHLEPREIGEPFRGQVDMWGAA